MAPALAPASRESALRASTHQCDCVRARSPGARGMPRAGADLGDVVESWQVGGSCPGAAMLCKLVREPACGRQCLTQQQQTIIAAVAAICANPC